MKEWEYEKRKEESENFDVIEECSKTKKIYTTGKTNKTRKKK